MSESYADQLSRVVAMAEGDHGDLSHNDIAALREVLLDRKRLKADLTDARAELAAAKAKINQLKARSSSWAVRWLDAFTQSLDQPENGYLVEELKPLFWRLNKVIKSAEQEAKP